jgi:hypothetical protein
MSDLADKLRERIEAKHAKALQALKELEDYLDDPDLPQPNSAAKEVENHFDPGLLFPQERHRRKRRLREDSFRARVIKIITAAWATVNQIAEQTGLEVKQVRGVINAPDMSSRLERRPSESGDTEYHLRSEESE